MQSQQAPPYNRTSRVAAWNEQRRQASANQARVATASGINSSPSGPAHDAEPWHLQEPLYRDHSGFPITRGMMERSVRKSRLRFSDNFTQMNIPCAGSPDQEDQEEHQPRLEQPRLDPQYDEISLAEALRMDSPAGFNVSAGYNSSAGVNPSDGFNGNPLVTIIPPTLETKPTSLDSRTSNSHPMMLEGENGPKNEKKKKLQEIKEKAKEAKTWLLKSARDGYAQRGL